MVLYSDLRPILLTYFLDLRGTKNHDRSTRKEYLPCPVPVGKNICPENIIKMVLALYFAVEKC